MQDPAFFWNAQSARFAEAAGKPGSFYARRTAWVAEIIARHAHGGLAIDIGCGAGQLCLELARRGFDVHGVDISQPQIDAAIRNGHSLFEAPEQRFRLCDANAIPFEGRFQVVTAIGVLPYVENQARFIERAIAHLAPGGLFLVSNTNRTSLFTLVALLQHLQHFRPSRAWLAVFLNLATTGIWSGGFVESHMAVRCRSARALDGLCQRLGLVAVDSLDMYNLGCGFDRSPLDRAFVGRTLARAFGWTHIGVYRARAIRHE